MFWQQTKQAVPAKAQRKQSNDLSPNGQGAFSQTRILQLQQTLGNRATMQLMKNTVMQRKPSQDLGASDVGQWFVVQLPGSRTKVGRYLKSDASGHWFRGENREGRESQFAIISGNVEPTHDPGWGGPQGFGEEAMVDEEEAIRPTRPGLHTAEVQEGYSGHVKKVASEFRTSPDPNHRLRLLAQGIAPMFEASGVPTPDFHLIPRGTLRRGDFDSTSWSAGISEAALETDDPAKVASTMFHESRHSEQMFLIARYILQKGLDAPLHDQIPSRIFHFAREANSRVPLSVEEQAEAKSYYDSFFGKDSKERNFKLKRLAEYTGEKVGIEHGKWEAAKARADEIFREGKRIKDQLDTPSLSAEQIEQINQEVDQKRVELAKARALRDVLRQSYMDLYEKWKKAIEEYRNLPEEADAFKVQAEFEEILKK